METAAAMQPLNQKRILVVTIRDLYSAVVALIPVIMILNVPVLNMGLSTILLGLFAPYALLQYRRGKKAVALFPFFLLIGYLLTRSMGNLLNQILLAIVLVHIFGVINGSLNIRITRKVIEGVTLAATVCVLLQTALYYTMGIRFTFLVEPLLLEENRHYVEKIAVGMFRPSAFFLEPSHYAQYCCIGLLSVLFPLDGEKVNMKKAMWIILGCLLTTSGMGIGLCVGVFGWYILFTHRKNGGTLKRIIGWSLAALVAFAVLMQFSFFSQAVQRIFGEVDGYNAISGRLFYWEYYIGTMRASQLILGKGMVNVPEGYMTGLMAVIYSYGYVGLGLMILTFIYLFIRGRSNAARCLCVVYCCLMCVENLFGFLSLSFWLSVIIACAIEANSKQMHTEVS